MKKLVCQKLIKKKSSQIIEEAFVYTGTRDMIKSINAEEMMRKQLKTMYRNNTNECVIEAMKFEDEEKKKEKLKFDSCYRTMSPLEICRDLYSDYYSLILSYTNEHMRIKIMYKNIKRIEEYYDINSSSSYEEESENDEEEENDEEGESENDEEEENESDDDEETESDDDDENDEEEENESDDDEEESENDDDEETESDDEGENENYDEEDTGSDNENDKTIALNTINNTKGGNKKKLILDYYKPIETDEFLAFVGLSLMISSYNESKVPNDKIFGDDFSRPIYELCMSYKRFKDIRNYVDINEERKE